MPMPFSRMRKRGMWIVPEVLVGLVVAAIIIAAIGFGMVKLYGVLFNEDDGGMETQFDIVNQRINSLLQNPLPFAFDYFTYQAPQDKDYVVLGFDKYRPGYSIKGRIDWDFSERGKVIEKPSKECGEGSCLCYFSYEDIEARFEAISENEPESEWPPVPSPKSCTTFDHSIIFSSHIELQASDTNTLQGGKKWDGFNFADYGGIIPYTAAEVPNPATDKDYYQEFVLGQKKSTVKTFYIEKIILPNPSDTKKKMVFIFLSDYSETTRQDIDKRQAYLQTCPHNPEDATCDYKYANAPLEDPSCVSSRTSCIFVRALGKCVESCIPACPSGAITRTCVCEGEARVSGECQITGTTQKHVPLSPSLPAPSP